MMVLRAVYQTVTSLLALVLLAGCGGGREAVDQTTPRGTVMAALQAIEHRDAALLTQCFSPEAPAGYADALAAVLKASASLQEAGAARFGKEDAKSLVGAAGPGTDDWRTFRQAQETVQGNDATLRAADGRTIVLRKDGAHWRIVRDWMTSDPATAQHAVPLLQRIANLLRAVEQDIRSSKYEDAQLACTALSNGLLAATREPE